MIQKSTNHASEEVKPLFPGIDFRDSFLMDFEFSRTLDQIRAVVYSPGENKRNNRGAFFEIIFNAVVQFQLESVGIGEPNDPVELSAIYTIKSAEYKRWRKRLAFLAQPGTSGYATTGSKAYQAVYHVVLESVVYAGFGVNDYLQGLQIICRHFTLKDVTKDWSRAKKPQAYRIPGKIQ